MRTSTVVGAQGDPVRKAARSVAITVALASLLLVIVVTAAAVWLFDREQWAEIGNRVQVAASTADDTFDPPPGIWLIERTDSGTVATPGTPQFVLDAADRVLATTDAARSDADPPGDLDSLDSLDTSAGPLPAALATQSGRTVVAVYDVQLHRAEESRLIRSALLAGGVGVLLAGGVGLIAGRRAVRPLAAALELQREFVADASHELRTPLAVISTRAQMVQRHLSPQVSEQHRVEVDQLVQDTRAMGEVVSDLLLSAQLEHAPVAADLVDLDEVADDVVKSLAAYAAEQSVSLVCDSQVGRASGRAAGEATVLGVRTGLRRATLALVDNAISHSPAGGEVRVAVTPGTDLTRLSVSDHGQGVAAADLDRITRRFARARPHESGGRRVGLGLALVSQVVRSHHGHLSVEDTPGGGATFTISLPTPQARGSR